ALSPTLQLRRSWTPVNEHELDVTDADLGSMAPALLAHGFAVQGGKDGKLRLLSLARLSGHLGARGGELQTVALPGGTPTFTTPAVWRGTWTFVANAAGTEAWRLVKGRLRPAWRAAAPGTSPVVAGGLLYVFDPTGGGLRAYVPASGRLVATLPAGTGHWQ